VWYASKIFSHKAKNMQKNSLILLGVSLLFCESSFCGMAEHCQSINGESFAGVSYLSVSPVPGAKNNLGARLHPSERVKYSVDQGGATPEQVSSFLKQQKQTSSTLGQSSPSVPVRKTSLKLHSNFGANAHSAASAIVAIQTRNSQIPTVRPGIRQGDGSSRFAPVQCAGNRPQVYTGSGHAKYAGITPHHIRRGGAMRHASVRTEQDASMETVQPKPPFFATNQDPFGAAIRQSAMSRQERSRQYTAEIRKQQTPLARLKQIFRK
jgi:hypothetical protein